MSDQGTASLGRMQTAHSDTHICAWCFLRIARGDWYMRVVTAPSAEVAAYLAGGTRETTWSDVWQLMASRGTLTKYHDECFTASGVVLTTVHDLYELTG